MSGIVDASTLKSGGGTALPITEAGAPFYRKRHVAKALQACGLPVEEVAHRGNLDEMPFVRTDALQARAYRMKRLCLLFATMV